MNTAIVGAFEAKNRFSELLEKANQGRETVVTKHGHPIAKIVPFRENEESSDTIYLSIAKTRKQIAQRGDVIDKGETWKEIARKGLRS